MLQRRKVTEAGVWFLKEQDHISTYKQRQMGISQGLGSGATNSSTEEIRVIELSINNETHRKAAPILTGFTLVLVPPWVFISIFYIAWEAEGAP